MTVDIVGMITQAAGPQIASQIGARVGLNPQQAQVAMAALLPVIAGAMKRGGGAPAAPAVDAAHPQATAAGNDILGRIFGSKDVSRSVAQDASAKTGIDASQLKALLPLLATMTAGAAAAPAPGTPAAARPGGLMGMLDGDGDGNPMNDLAGLAGRFLQR